MPPHVLTSGNESDGTWLPLIEYSVKTGVSLSTIRRKIKNNTIQYRLEKGRYLIMHNEAGHRDMKPQPVQPTSVAAPIPQPVSVAADVDRWENKPLSRLSPSHIVNFDAKEEEEARALPMVEKAVTMVSDAFEYALVQKEEQIRMLEQRNRDLEDRIAELKLLVKVIEEKYKVRY